jgi:2-polyprenyl-3-methyl-5-hydroxy-6-metoxy-1,4-benzoquinol methylase
VAIRPLFAGVAAVERLVANGDSFATGFAAMLLGGNDARSFGVSSPSIAGSGATSWYPFRKGVAGVERLMTSGDTFALLASSRRGNKPRARMRFKPASRQVQSVRRPEPELTNGWSAGIQLPCPEVTTRNCKGMMITRQQQEALCYFNEHAREWKERAYSADEQEVNVTRQRNGFALSVIEHRPVTRSTLDVGCGTGDLVCDIARTGIEAPGVDFSLEMVDIARARAEHEELDQAHFYCSSIFCSSIFDFDLAQSRYDVVSAIGFIEYISLEELDRFLDLSHQALNPSGSGVLGSRNRLFNIFSLSSFTLEEINTGMATLLLGEATQLASGVGIAALAGSDTVSLQKPCGEQTRTGIDVSVRYQFTPGQLATMLKARGLAIEQLYPVHVHGVPPAFKADHPATHTSISNLLQNYATEQSLVPYSSSFMYMPQRSRRA